MKPSPTTSMDKRKPNAAHSRVGGCGIPRYLHGFRALARKRVRLPLLLSVAVALLVMRAHSSEAVECSLGEPASASIGDGVILHSCSWEKTPGVFARTGPLQLVKNGILILALQTDAEGKLQGEYSSWDDDGRLMEKGYYVDGLKHGEWRVTEADGSIRTLYFEAGVEIQP